jgi:hypothetical protein
VAGVDARLIPDTRQRSTRWSAEPQQDVSIARQISAKACAICVYQSAHGCSGTAHFSCTRAPIGVAPRFPSFKSLIQREWWLPQDGMEDKRRRSDLLSFLRSWSRKTGTFVIPAAFSPGRLLTKLRMLRYVHMYKNPVHPPCRFASLMHG